MLDFVKNVFLGFYIFFEGIWVGVVIFGIEFILLIFFDKYFVFWDLVFVIENIKYFGIIIMIGKVLVLVSKKLFDKVSWINVFKVFVVFIWGILWDNV